MEWTALTVAVTPASLESYARLTLMTVSLLTVLEMDGVRMKTILSHVNVSLTILDHSVM